MKEASGEASNTVVVIILIAAILAAATLIVTNLAKRVDSISDLEFNNSKVSNTQSEVKKGITVEE